jgi:3-hydroxybutyryl-CoA dehydratase
VNTDTVDALRGTDQKGEETLIGEGHHDGVGWRERPPYFDGLEIGDSMESSGRTVTEYDVVSFASLTGDWHPQHADAAWAAESPFGRRIAHGMLVISYALGLLPIDPRVVMALRSIDSAILKRPVGLGDTIRVQAKVTALRPMGDEAGLVTLGVRILNQNDELVAKMDIVVLWRREPGNSPGPQPAGGALAGPALNGSREDELSPIQNGRFLA